MEKISVQAFYIKDHKIIIDNLPNVLYDGIQESVPEFYEKIDNKAWVMPITLEDKKYQIVMSRDIESVKDFMQAILFAEGVINAKI
jgi:hypothetical protein